MPINIIHFEHDGRPQWGVIREGRITRVPGAFATTAEFLQANALDALASLVGETLSERDVRLLSPVTRNQQFVCLGANYRQHMVESGMDPDAKAYNMFFTKASSCIVSALHDVVRPPHVRFLDYEVELGLVIKRDVTRGAAVTDSNLHEFIAGLVIVNDFSARDVQLPQGQFYKGKSYRTFGPVGPYLCLLEAADFRALSDLSLRLTVNQQVRQQDTTKNMVYRPAETLTELSSVHDLFVGDLISTGTPAGCALSVPPPWKQRVAALLPEAKKWALFMKIQAKRKQYLAPGDVVEARIVSADGTIDLGVQRNTIVEASA